MTQLQMAIKNRVTGEMKLVAKKEKIEIGKLKKWIRESLVVIPANKNHKNLKPIGIGSGLRVKVNANIGTSPVKSDLKTELKKLRVALEAGADTIMDLSIGGNLDKIRRALIKNCPVPFGTVPIYQTAIEAKKLEDMTINKYLQVFKKQARDGIDFATVHAGVTQKTFPLIKKRVMKCVSRGGSFLLAWMKYHRKENFLYENFEEILVVAKEYDVTLSLGDGLRPGCIADATDKAQIQELKILGELAERAKAQGVQVMIEGPGHLPLNEIEKNVKLAKKYCQKAPLYVLGPLPTDIAVGYDHIVCAVGGALAGWKGADFLCYVTPREHIGLPDIDDVREGVVITKIAAHIADLARRNKEAVLRDYQMAKARSRVNWKGMLKYTIDPQKFINLRKQEKLQSKELKYCSMCGPFCVFRTPKKVGRFKNHK
jgi:phosphomethylpyrimidine synthase